MLTIITDELRFSVLRQGDYIHYVFYRDDQLLVMGVSSTWETIWRWYDRFTESVDPQTPSVVQ